MKVCFINNLFYPYLGGAEFHLLNLGKNLIALGNDVTLITLKSNPSLPDRDVFQGISIIRVKNILELYRVLKKGNWDVVHASMSRKFFSYFGIIFAHRIGFPTFFTPHCFYSPKNSINRITKILFDHTVGAIAFNSIDVMINSTVVDREDALKIGLNSKKSVIIPNSIDCSEIDSISQSTLPDFREKYSVKNEFLLFVGRIDYIKNINFIISILPKIENSIDFVIIGQDEGYKLQLQQLSTELEVQDRIIWIEKAPFKDLISAYKTCKAFVLPSTKEGLPTVILEAMYLKKIVIVADTGGSKTVINNGYDGFLFSLNDYIESIPRIVNMLNTIDTETMGNRAREKVLNHYHWKTNSIKILELYQKYVQG